MIDLGTIHLDSPLASGRACVNHDPGDECEETRACNGCERWLRVLRVQWDDVPASWTFCDRCLCFDVVQYGEIDLDNIKIGVVAGLNG